MCTKCTFGAVIRGVGYLDKPVCGVSELYRGAQPKTVMVCIRSVTAVAEIQAKWDEFPEEYS